MAANLILWGHALAALLFVAAALRLRDAAPALPRPTLAAALALTALWALAVAGIDARDVVTRVLVGLRDVVWLVAVSAMLGRDRRRGGAVLALNAAAIGVMLLAVAIAVAAAGWVPPPAVAQALAQTRLALRALGLLAALILVGRLDEGRGRAAPARRLLAIALALIWGGDLTLIVVGRVVGEWPQTLVVARGGIIALAALFAAGAAGRGERPLAVSHLAAARVVAIVALAAYGALVALLTAIAEAYGGEHARLAQTAIVFGATAALLTLVSTPWLRAWGKVMVAKHLFRHRYDYRAEWQRFADTLAGGGAAAPPPLAERVARAMADLTVSPGALLLLAAGEGLDAATALDMTPPIEASDSTALAAYLTGSGRIVELDAVRTGTAPPDEAAAVPPGYVAMADAWAIVPLAHRGGLVGAVVLGRPPVDRSLDWEDLDLLRVAGRQAAGALAEDAARRALADAERFDEFNRRFAFILHDIKNLVSQLALVARNAERHADNPVFRADMIATLTESAGRMQALLARLSPHATRHDAVAPVDAAALLGAVRRRYRDRAVEVAAGPGLWMLADRAGLDTVLDHLVANALDAGEQDGTVTLHATPAADAVAIAVVDRGRGMSAAFVRDRLFRPFVSTKPGGFGLGAFEARQTIEAMGGRIDVASREGEGTCITLHLPAAPALERAA